MKVITLCTQKGGVAKTTTAAALILGLRKKGYKVLGIDLDTQGNLTNLFNPDASYTVFDLVYRKQDEREKVIEKDFIGGGLGLMYLSNFYKEHQLGAFKEALSFVDDRYDFCIIDTAPAVNEVVMSALAASDYYIMPTEPTRFALDGLNKSLQAAESVANNANPNLKLLGTLLVKFKDRYTLHKQFRDALKAEDKRYCLFDTTIRESQAINTASAVNDNFFSKEYASSNASKDYLKFIDELLTRIGESKKKKK